MQRSFPQRTQPWPLVKGNGFILVPVVPERLGTRGVMCGVIIHGIETKTGASKLEGARSRSLFH